MINLPPELYTRVTQDNDVWIVVVQISPTLAICAREVDVNTGSDRVTLVLMEI